MIWTLYGAIVSPSGDSIYPRYFQEVTWNSHLSAQANSPLVRSLQSTPECGLCAQNVVGIDEDVIQIYDDYDIDHIHKDVMHQSLKSFWCISTIPPSILLSKV